MNEELRDCNTTTPEIRYVPPRAWDTAAAAVLVEYEDLWRRLADAGPNESTALTENGYVHPALDPAVVAAMLRKGS